MKFKKSGKGAPEFNKGGKSKFGKKRGDKKAIAPGMDAARKASAMKHKHDSAY